MGSDQIYEEVYTTNKKDLSIAQIFPK